MKEVHARTARHEALHAVAAIWVGWPLDAVVRLHAGGLHGQTYLSKTPPPGDPRDTALKKAVISVIPAVDDPQDDTVSDDLNDADVMVRLGGVPLSEVWATAQALLADPEFRRQVRVVESALYERTLLSGAEVRRLIYE